MHKLQAKRTSKRLRDITRREVARNRQTGTFMNRHNCDLKCKTPHERKAEVFSGLAKAVIWS